MNTDDFEVISTYSRKQAIEDGMLIDLTPMMAQYGMKVFKLPTACTHAVWESCIAWDDENDGTGQSVSGRLYDVIGLASVAVENAGETDRAYFSLDVVKRGDVTGEDRERFRLYIHIGPGDEAEPVLTIMMEDED